MTNEVIENAPPRAPRPPLRPPRPWTSGRLARVFADRLGTSLVGEFFHVDLGMDPEGPVGADPAPALARLLAGAAARAGGVDPLELEPFLERRRDLVEAAAAALAAPARDFRFAFEHGLVKTAVTVPSTFLRALAIVAARIREEAHEQA